MVEASSVNEDSKVVVAPEVGRCATLGLYIPGMESEINSACLRSKKMRVPSFAKQVQAVNDVDKIFVPSIRLFVPPETVIAE